MYNRGFLKVVSIGVLSFSLGILLSFFIPEKILVVLMALLIMAMGALCLVKK